MKRLLLALLLSLSLANLGGCVLAVGNGDDASDSDSSWHDTSSGSSLARAVRARLDGDELTHGADLSVSSDSAGRVYLGGITSNPEVVGRALKLALDTPDVKSVRCRITLIK
jgi:hypothetical protein